MASPVHLTKRFLETVVPLGPRKADRQWAVDQLLPGEVVLWARMKPADRRPSAQQLGARYAAGQKLVVQPGTVVRHLRLPSSRCVIGTAGRPA